MQLPLANSCRVWPHLRSCPLQFKLASYARPSVCCQNHMDGIFSETVAFAADGIDMLWESLCSLFTWKPPMTMKNPINVDLSTLTVDSSQLEHTRALVKHIWSSYVLCWCQGPAILTPFIEIALLTHYKLLKVDWYRGRVGNCRTFVLLDHQQVANRQHSQ